jgi:hypothetical protein
MAVVQIGALWASFIERYERVRSRVLILADFFASLNHLKTNIKRNYIYAFISFLAVATLQIGYKQSLCQRLKEG